MTRIAHVYSRVGLRVVSHKRSQDPKWNSLIFHVQRMHGRNGNARPALWDQVLAADNLPHRAISLVQVIAHAGA